MKVVTAELMRSLDAKAIQEIGIPGVVLMENAGRAATDVILQRWPTLQDLKRQKQPKSIIFCGKGNNGGDGFVIGRHLHNRGIKVHFFLLAQRSEIQGDARINLDIACKMNLPVSEMTDVASLQACRSHFQDADLLIDALLGTGLRLEVKGLYRDVIEEINRFKCPIVAVDIPSGLSSDTGQALGVAVQATLTVTFGLPKVGQLLYPGAQYVGELITVDISIPSEIQNAVDTPFECLEAERFVDLLKKRPRNSHKGTFGHLFILAGSPGMTGAATLVGEAAMRAGTGLVTVGVPKPLSLVIEMKLTECLKFGLASKDDGVLAKEAISQIIPMLPRYQAIVIGPGLSTQGDVSYVVPQMIQQAKQPMVIDADGLNALSFDALDVLKSAQAPLILTPHPGEMARLLNVSTAQIQNDRIGVAKRFATDHQVILVLKGARTLVASPCGKVFINPTGNPGMACGGTGDVLAGMIGGFLAQGLNPLDATLLGVFLHGFSGDLAAKELGERSLIASDLLHFLPRAIASIEQAR